MDISESPDPQQPSQQQQPQLFPSNQSGGTIADEPELDIDSNLLRQFSCLGTTDHEDLINDLQRLFDNQLNKESARFFLEMSNWNLQTAICCYLDFCHFQNLPSMKIIRESRPSEMSQAWKLQNDGEEDWPSGCYLMSPSQTKRLDVPSLRPGDTCDIVADIPLSSPPIFWRLFTPNGWYFGEPIWMIPSGSGDTTNMDLAERMAQLRTTMSDENSPQVNVVILLKMD